MVAAAACIRVTGDPRQLRINQALAAHDLSVGSHDSMEAEGICS
ncbi:hypothetical protein [Microbacterium sp. P5_E9]